MLEALRAVADERARMVMAFTLEGYLDSVIAAEMGVDAQKVRNLRSKARTSLRRHLAADRAQEGGAAR